MLLIGLGVLLMGFSMLLMVGLNVVVLMALNEFYKMYKPFMKKMFESLEDKA